MASHGLTLIESETKAGLSTAMVCIFFAARPEQVVMACEMATSASQTTRVGAGRAPCANDFCGSV